MDFFSDSKDLNDREALMFRQQTPSKKCHQRDCYNDLSFVCSNIDRNKSTSPPMSRLSSSTSIQTNHASYPGQISEFSSTDSDSDNGSLRRDDLSRQALVMLHRAFAGVLHHSLQHDNVDNLRISTNIGQENYFKSGDISYQDGLKFSSEDDFGVIGRKIKRDAVESSDVNYICKINNHEQNKCHQQSKVIDENGEKESNNHHRRNNSKNSINSHSSNRNDNNTSIYDEESNHSTNSEASQIPTNHSSFLTALMSSISGHRKKLGTCLITMISFWIYSQYQQSRNKINHRHLQHRKSNIVFNHSRVTAFFTAFLRMLSPLRVLSHLYHNLPMSRWAINVSTKAAEMPKSQRTSMHPWKNATSTPLPHLLAMAKTGNILKVLLHGSDLIYMHSNSSSSSSPDQQKGNEVKQHWSKTTIPSQNSHVLQEVMSNLLNHGCHDITTLPDSLWQRFLNGPALIIFPFAYLGALYWIMKRLQSQQLEDGSGGDENSHLFSWKKNGSTKDSSRSHYTTTFNDVAGIDSALRELSEVVSYIRNPNAFHLVGASPPRGILLHGRPGSGKTLLAKAVAGEASRNMIDEFGRVTRGNRVNCFAVCSGSDFVETYVGRGAARVRAFFRGVREEAWKDFNKCQREARRNMDTAHNVSKKFTRYNTISNDGNILSSKVEDRIHRRRGSSVMLEVGDKMLNVWEKVPSFLIPQSRFENFPEGCGQQRPIAIIFIDEIDAIGKRRDGGMGIHASIGGCDEREQTLNQLLIEMDGFSVSSSLSPAKGPEAVIVIVIAATNRPEVLDPALLRSGRFDRHVHVPLPDSKGREAILRVHARQIKYDPSSVNFHSLSAGESGKSKGISSMHSTHNFSGADLRNVIKEAALFAVKEGSPDVKQHHLEQAVQKVRKMIDCIF